MDLFTDKQQYALVIPFDVVDPDVMVGDDDQVKPRLGGRLGDLGMVPDAVRVGCVNV
jgi:hypothetical protein